MIKYVDITHVDAEGVQETDRVYEDELEDMEGFTVSLQEFVADFGEWLRGQGGMVLEVKLGVESGMVDRFVKATEGLE